MASARSMIGMGKGERKRRASLKKEERAPNQELTLRSCTEVRARASDDGRKRSRAATAPFSRWASSVFFPAQRARRARRPPAAQPVG